MLYWMHSMMCSPARSATTRLQALCMHPALLPKYLRLQHCGTLPICKGLQQLVRFKCSCLHSRPLPALWQAKTCMHSGAQVASKASERQPCSDTCLCMPREEYTALCPAFAPSEIMPEKLEAFKAGDLQILCINPYYAFGQV